MAFFFLYVFLFIVCFVLCVLAWKFGRQEKKKLLDAELDYQNALFQLRRNPNNPELRTKALELGREYAFLSREMEGVFIFDELALMNDLQAASAASGQNLHREKATIQERIDRLNDLRNRGYLTNEEYELKKKQILEDL